MKNQWNAMFHSILADTSEQFTFQRTHFFIIITKKKLFSKYVDSVISFLVVDPRRCKASR